MKVRPETKFQEACDAIRKGDLSVRQAAFQYGFSKSTLHDAVTRKHIKKSGGQTILTNEEEAIIVDHLLTLSQWGFPLDMSDLRVLIKMYLQVDRRGVTIKRLKNNFPGCDWACSFLKQRMNQNIQVAGAKVTPSIIHSYFRHLEATIENIPPDNLINYNETNLSDDPGRKKVIIHRGCKYPERITNSTKSSVSLMFACTASGKILPPYVVYKAKHFYDLRTEGGPSNTRYNRTDSGWFDSTTPPQAEPNTSEASGASTSANSEVVTVRSALDAALVNMLSNYRYGPSTSTSARGKKKRSGQFPLEKV
ncbi:uncharacterized protein [Macrobrachium rosenbergii]|uniref:uncharacterized protein n=1 Tax=Macrobrachium rosenbergii TaxID=79674 RepID=UPI0034D4EBE8